MDKQTQTTAPTEDLFTKEELEIDFTICVNMYSGMPYREAKEEAIKEYTEYLNYKRSK